MVKFELNHAQFLKSYDNSVRFHVDALLSGLGKNTPFEKIGEDELQGCIAKWRTQKYKRGSNKSLRVAAPATINRRIAIFRKVHNLATYSWKVNAQHINFGKLKLAEPEPPNNPLSREEADIIIKAAPEHIRHFIMLSVYTGLRKSAILSLGKENIDFNNRRITTAGKSNKPGGKRITVSIPDVLAEYMLEYGLHQEEFCITYEDLPVQHIHKAWKSLFAETGIPYRRPHDMRHTFATWLYEDTKDIMLVKERLHHASITTTARYAHSNEDDDRRVNEAMNKRVAPESRQNKIRRVK